MFNIVVLGIVSFLTDVSTEMVYPLIPIFLTTTLGAGPAIVGVIEGIAESIASLLVEKALLADIAPSHLRGTVIGLHATLVGLALLPASLLAGFLWDLLGASAPFYFGASMGLLAAVGLFVILKE